MNWTRIVVAAVVAGIVGWLADFVMHGLILGHTYTRYPVFSQESANPLAFLAVSVTVAFFAAIFFARTADSWSPGWRGGVAFGFFLGLVTFFSNHYYPLVLEGFPYFLAWCWGGVGLIGGVITGAVIGAIYKKKA